MHSEPLLRAIQDSLVQANIPVRDCQRVGGFLAMLHPSDALEWLNWATIEESIDKQDIAELVTHFKSKQRVPRLELFHDLWPAEIVALEEAGFERSNDFPIMILEKERWSEREPPLSAEIVQPADALETRRMLDIAFGAEGPVAEEADNSELALTNGSYLGAKVVLGGKVVGAGFAVGTRRIREIAGIGTLPEYRRRGVAGSVIQSLLNRFFLEGGEVAWLTPGHDEAQNLYESLGFRTVGRQICLTYRD